MMQIAGMIVIVLWVVFFSALYFYGMDKLKLLRVSILDEVIGLDIAEMGSSL